MAALVLGGCQSDAPDNTSDAGEYITFGQPVLEVSDSRSTLIDAFGDGEGQLNGFTVWGYCKPADAYGNDGKGDASALWNNKVNFITRADVFDGIAVNVKSDGTTQYDSPKQWLDNNNDSYTYSFIALANYGSVANIAHSIKGSGNARYPELTFNMPFDKLNATNENQINTALESSISDQVPDVLLASVFDRTRRMGKVPMAFQHMLTGVRFRAINKSGQELKIKKVTLSGRFYRTAYYSFETTTVRRRVDALEDNAYAGTFTVFNGNQTVIDGASAILGQPETDINALGNVLLLLPNPDGRPPVGDNDADAVYSLGDHKMINIEYTLTPKDGSESATKKGSTGIFSLHYVPKPNTLHTANLTFTGDRVILLFQADNDTNWEFGSDNDIDIN